MKLKRSPYTDDELLDYIFKKRYGHWDKCRIGDHYNNPFGGLEFYRLKKRPVYSCSGPNSHHISPLAGTIFEKSTTPLSTWYTAMVLVRFFDISGAELQQQLGVTYKCAWRIKDTLKKADGQSNPLADLI